MGGSAGPETLGDSAAAIVNGDPSPELERWLLEPDDPSLRWRVLEEIHGRAATDPDVTTARDEVGHRGWAKEILATQLPTGQWDAPGASGPELYRPKYIATNWRLLVLADLGASRATPGIDRAVERMFAAEAGPKGGLGGSGSEVCFTGNCVRMFASFGYADDPRLTASIDWLLSAQKADGGWHCFPSETGTIDCWEALAAFAALPPSRRSPAVVASVRRGAEFYLSRGLLGETEGPYEPWLRIHYPNHYYYDFLVGLDVLTRLGYAGDPRLGPALARLERMRNGDGTWSMGPLHPDLPPFEGYQIELPFFSFGLEMPGQRSRWLTITALAVRRRVAEATKSGTPVPAPA